jgi:hypothetical protein
MSIDDQIDNYFAARKAIFDHVKYRERWRDMPFEDSREQFWAITDRKSKVKFSPDRAALDHWLTHDDYGEYGDKVFENEISDHAGESGIYRGVEVTLVVADTNTDGNVFLQIFRNMNEIVLCSCGKLPTNVGDDNVQRCRECMFTHRMQQHRAEQKP